MAYYIVFGSVKRPTDFMGGKRLDWGQPPVGVYEAATPADACQAAASDQGQMATYIAIEGTPWGIDLMEAPARQLGRTVNPNERIAEHLDRIDRLEEQRRTLEQIKEVEAKHKLTAEQEREERRIAAEAKSDEMEREAGLGPYAPSRESPYGEEH